MEVTTELLSSYFDRLWPIHRSITGEGYRDSLSILSELIPFKQHSWKSGEHIYDWVVPLEWTIRSASIWQRDNKAILNLRKSNLHVVGYSEPQGGYLPWRLLCEHVYTVPELPDVIPYVTSYFSRYWGFCMAYEQYKKLAKQPDAKYFFNIDSELKKGQLVVGDLLLRGKSDKEILLSTYLCHPTAVDGLSGPLVMAGIYQKLKDIKLRHSIRLVVNPENIGMIAYLSRFGKQVKKNVVAGYILSTVGHPIDKALPYCYKKSKQGNSFSDKAALHVLKHRGKVNSIDYFPDGSDERVTETQGYNLGIGLIMRKMYGTYREYHTSADNRDLICFDSMLEMIDTYVEVIKALDCGDRIFDSTIKYGTPMFAKHAGLYQSTMKLSNFIRPTQHRRMLLDLANYCDGSATLLDIAEQRKHYILDLLPVVDELLAAQLLKEVK